MSAFSGALVLIKIGDGEVSESFTTIGGLRVCAMGVNSQMLNSSTIGSGAWRSALDGAGMRAMSISGNGIFTDSAAEETLRTQAFSNGVKNYRFVFGNGDSVTGAFFVTAYQRSGAYDGEETYSLTLQSAGAISFTGA